MVGLILTSEKNYAVVYYADGLGLIPKDSSKTHHPNFDPPWRGWLPSFSILRGTICMGTWTTLHPWRILYAPGALSGHRQISKCSKSAFRQASLSHWPSCPVLSALSTGPTRSFLMYEDDFILVFNNLKWPSQIL